MASLERCCPLCCENRRCSPEGRVLQTRRYLPSTRVYCATGQIQASGAISVAGLGLSPNPAYNGFQAAVMRTLFAPDPYAHLVTRGRHVPIRILKGFNDITDLLVHHDRVI